MLRLAVVSIVAAVGFLLAAGPAATQQTPLFPGVTYENGVQFTPHGPVAIRVVRGPKPVGLYRLRTTLSNELVLGRETVSSMQRRLATQATMVGVNGDLSRFADGKPSGIMLRDGVLIAPPNGQRSSAGIGLDGMLDVRRVAFRGTWRGTGQRRSLTHFNDVPGKNGIALLTSDYGRVTPTLPGSYTVVLSPFPASVPNTDLVAPVTTTSSGSVRLAPGTAAVVARGNAAARLQAEAAVGTSLTLRLILQPDWATVSDAIGGGPVLVRDGKPVYRANEAFTVSQIAPRHPRTAIGQLADGRILMVVVDGRQPGYSVGMTTFEMALTMARLGAVRAMQLDGGGSSTIAFQGKVLNRPSDGFPRAVAEGLFVFYYGIYAPTASRALITPNGDAVSERTTLSAKVVRPSIIDLKLLRPNGTVAWRSRRGTLPGTFRKVVGSSVMGDGVWRWVVQATENESGRVSTMTRSFKVNRTLGHLRLSRERLPVVPGRTVRVFVSVVLARQARVGVVVLTRGGLVRRVIYQGDRGRGKHVWSWDGRRTASVLVPSGTYVVRVRATNSFGTLTLRDTIRVVR